MAWKLQQTASLQTAMSLAQMRGCLSCRNIFTLSSLTELEKCQNAANNAAL